MLAGRVQETSALEAVLDSARAGVGRAVVIRGEAGSGKTALVEWVSRHAGETMSPLSLHGVAGESSLPYAGLHQILRPLLREAAHVGELHRATLQAAFGLLPAEPDVVRVAVATLDVLVHTARDRPVLVLVDDAHLLDGPTTEILEFVAGRVAGASLALVMATRPGCRDPLAGSDIAEIRLAPLDSATAEEVVRRHAADLDDSEVRRVLDRAAGNPLALVEAAQAPTRCGTAPPEAVVRSFTADLADLPAAARAWALLASAEPDASPEEIRVALAQMGHPTAPVERLPVFWHPLVGPAIYAAARASERASAHRALVIALEGRPDLGVWHRAAVATGHDEQLVRDLQSVAAQARDAATSVRALRAAARLDRRRRSSLLVEAATIAVATGERRALAELLDDLPTGELDPVTDLRVLAVREAAAPGGPAGPGRIDALASGAERVAAADASDLAVDLVRHAALRCLLTGADERARRAVAAAARSVGTPGDARILASLAFVEPELLPVAATRRSVSTLEEAVHVGSAAFVVGEMETALDHWRTVRPSLESTGRLGVLAPLLAHSAWAAVAAGRWEDASALAAETARIAAAIDDVESRLAARGVDGILAAWRGDVEQAEAIAREGQHRLATTGSRHLYALLQSVRVVAALTARRHHDAYLLARPMLEPGQTAAHYVVAWWVLPLLAEAAAHTGDVDEALALLAGLPERPTAPAWVAARAAASALLASGPDADALFVAALDPGSDGRPVDRARLLLAHGSRLRRDRRPGDSREPLREAAQIFDRLGAAPWAERAREELRAAGVGSSRAEVLSPQEWEIAKLAADGLTNRQIGEQLFLSHRTVGSHLYRIFPKLGIGSRAQLTEALSRREPDRADDAR